MVAREIASSEVAHARRESGVLLAFALAIVVGGFLFDLWMPIGVGSSVVYTLLVLLSIRAAGARSTWLAAAVATALTLLGLAIDLWSDTGPDHWKGYVNRATSTFTFWAMAWLGVGYKRGRERLERERTVMLRAEQLATLGEMAAGVAHELGTPLGALQGRLEMLDHEIEAGRVEPAALRRTLRIATGLVDRMGKGVRSMRNLARDASTDPFVDVPVERIVREVLAILEERLRKLAIEVQLGPLDPTLRIHCRDTQIGQVLLNLIANAADAVADLPERWIRLEVASHADRVTITVTDSGPGIAPELREWILQPFFTTKPAGHGTGLGLSVSRAFVQAHGGTLELDPDWPHTRFVVSLPIRS